MDPFDAGLEIGGGTNSDETAGAYLVEGFVKGSLGKGGIIAALEVVKEILLDKAINILNRRNDTLQVALQEVAALGVFV